MTISDTLTASLEDYLEAIFNIIKEKQAAKPNDVAKMLKVKNASVTGALHSLAEKKLINYAPYEIITLTPEGKIAAKDIVRRHEVLRDFFVKVLSVENTIAEDAACKMEHSIPRSILERLIDFAEFVDTCPRGGSKWVAGFGYQCDNGASEENCEKCMTQILEDFKKQKINKGTIYMQHKNLKDLKPGQKGRVLKVVSRGEAARRITEMGIIPGTIVEVERIAPLGDPIDIKVKGYHLSLRKEDAEKINLETV